MSIRRYSELILLPTFEERFDYLKCGGVIGVPTFGGHRYLNQMLYTDPIEWKRFRDRVILRDGGFDLGCKDVPIEGNIFVHHIEPLTIDDILNRSSCIFDMENAISSSFKTHNALHYGNGCPKVIKPEIRKMHDTCPWR